MRDYVKGGGQRRLRSFRKNYWKSSLHIHRNARGHWYLSLKKNHRPLALLTAEIWHPMSWIQARSHNLWKTFALCRVIERKPKLWDFQKKTKKLNFANLLLSEGCPHQNHVRSIKRTIWTPVHKFWNFVFLWYFGHILVIFHEILVRMLWIFEFSDFSNFRWLVLHD